ncbi:unnamed protein product [Protopolystoma xenopodis]|uniref:Uncharacterized protein n=1 Tax=Protopolystoma xenopodis TaxID=117903 RepID=A0A3S5A3W2_9PLAT|nr:unnamed protein product [Protopolystoma xenopodis]
MDPEAFMAMVAKDAEERAARRAKSRQSAAKLKERANTFYKVGDWQRAIDLYSQAIEVCRDWNVLYSNRAQAKLL